MSNAHPQKKQQRENQQKESRQQNSTTNTAQPQHSQQQYKHIAAATAQNLLVEQHAVDNPAMAAAIAGGGANYEYSSSSMASESEEMKTGSVKHHHQLQEQSSLDISNNSQTTSIAALSGGGGPRMDDDDPIFTLDEDIHAKSAERTRHYTADFDPTVSDDDEFPKEMGGNNQLHGGRAYSASNRFPPRIRHSGRSGHLQHTTGIYHHRLHGQHHPHPGTGGGGLVPSSLPIQISRGFNWPPRELAGSLSEEEESSANNSAGAGGGGDVANKKPPLHAIIGQNISERTRAKTAIALMNSILSERETSAAATATEVGSAGQQTTTNWSEREDLYGRMQAYSRSIQPEDDPERLFGERPHRRCSIAPQMNRPSGNSSSEEQQQQEGREGGGGGKGNNSEVVVVEGNGGGGEKGNTLPYLTNLIVQ